MSLEKVSSAVGREMGDDLILAVSKRERRDLRYSKLGERTRGVHNDMP